MITFLQVFRPEPSKSESTSSCSRKFTIFLSWWHRKWTSPAIILVGLKCHQRHNDPLMLLLLLLLLLLPLLLLLLLLLLPLLELLVLLLLLEIW